MSSPIYDDGFTLQFTPREVKQALRSVAINNDGAPELRFDSSPHTPSLSEEDVAAMCRLVFEGKRPNFTYHAIDKSHPFYGRQYMVYDPPWLKGTSVGDVLAEVDWKMKCLNVGAQTDKSRSVFFSREKTSVTKGLATILDFADDNPDSPGYMFTRCAGVQVQEYDDEMVFYSDPKLSIDFYKSKAYSEYMTRVLPLIAEHDEPSFLKLQEIIKMVLAAEWLKEKGIEMSEKWMKSCGCCKDTAVSRTPADNSADRSRLLSEIKNFSSLPRKAVNISMDENEQKRSKRAHGTSNDTSTITCYGWYDNGSGEMVQYREDGEWYKEYQSVRIYSEQVVTVNGKSVDSGKWLTNIGIFLPNKLRVKDIWKLEKDLVAVKEHHQVSTILGPFSVNIQVNRNTEERGKKMSIAAEIRPYSVDHKMLPCIEFTTTVRESTHDWDFIYQGLNPQRPMMPVPEISEHPLAPDAASWNELYSQTVPWPRVWVSSPEGPGVLSATGGVRTDTLPVEKVERSAERKLAPQYSSVVEARTQGTVKLVTSHEVQQLFQRKWTGTAKGPCPTICCIFSITNSGLLQKWKRYKDSLKKDNTVERCFHGTALKCGLVSNIDQANDAALCQNSKCGVCGIANEGFSPNHIRDNVFQRFGKGFYLAPNSSKASDYPIHKDPNDPYRAQLLCDVCPGKKYELQTTDQYLDSPPEGYNSVYGQVGQDLNYPEIVIYDTRAIMPCYVIVY